MAFIDFSDAAPRALHASSLDSSTGASPPNILSDPVDVLSALERRVIELARHDGLDSLRPPPKRGWFARLVLGPAPISPILANARLEALRQLAVQAWHKGYTLPASALKAAKRAGFSEDQIGAVIDIIGRSRAPFRRPAA